MFGEIQSKARYDMGNYDKRGLERFRGTPGLKLPTRLPSFSETQDSGYSLNVNYRLTINGETKNIVDQIAFYESREKLEEHLEQWRNLIESDYNTSFSINITQTVRDEWGKDKTETINTEVSSILDKIFIIEPRNLVAEEFNKKQLDFDEEMDAANEIRGALDDYEKTQEVPDSDEFDKEINEIIGDVDKDDEIDEQENDDLEL